MNPTTPAVPSTKPAAAGARRGAAGAKPKPPLTREAKTAIAVAAVVVLCVAGGVAWYFRPTGGGGGAAGSKAALLPAPRIDDSMATIAKYVAQSGFGQIPFDRQRVYMEMLNDREEELRAAFNNGEIDETTLRVGLEYGWFGKQLPRMDKYLSLPEAERAAYVEERLDKKDGKGKKKQRGSVAGVTSTTTTPSSTPAVAVASQGAGPGVKPSTPPARPAPATPVASAVTASKGYDRSREVERDEQSEKDIPKLWPDDVRAKWKEYRNALKERREEREEEAELNAG